MGFFFLVAAGDETESRSRRSREGFDQESLKNSSKVCSLLSKRPFSLRSLRRLTGRATVSPSVPCSWFSRGGGGGALVSLYTNRPNVCWIHVVFSALVGLWWSDRISLKDLRGHRQKTQSTLSHLSFARMGHFLDADRHTHTLFLSHNH